nr:DUF4013 domain-containing protein [Allorhodopirellula solitaria]
MTPREGCSMSWAGAFDPSSAVLSSPPATALDVDVAATDANRTGWLWRTSRAMVVAARNLWCLSWLVVLLAVVTAIPLLQILVLGYLLLVAGRLANGETFRHSLPGLAAAGKIGVIAASLGIASLPIRLLVHWESVVAIIEPNSQTATLLRLVTILVSVLTTVYLWWAWVRGGQLRHFVWPEPIRFFRNAWRPSLWTDAADSFWRFLVSLRLPMLFWLGLRGAVGTLIWLLPAMLIMIVTRDGQRAAAGLVGVAALILLGLVLMTLPMLQAHFAAENCLRAIFQWRRVRRDLAYAPWSYAAAMLLTLVVLPLPLYLLKVEATPQEITWLPCVVFVAFMLPARIATGLALRRCRRLRVEASESGQPSRSRLRENWDFLSRWGVRLLVVPAIVLVYLVVLGASQYTSWDGVDTWVRQHALLVPVPFVGL